MRFAFVSSRCSLIPAWKSWDRFQWDTPEGSASPAVLGRLPELGELFFSFFLPGEDLRPVIHGAQPCLFSFSDDVPGNMT